LKSRLRRRVTILLVVACVSVTLLILLSVATRSVISRSFSKLDQDQGRRSQEQALRAIDADLNQLAISTRDYAHWDYSYEYVRTRDPRFVDANLAPAVLANMDVDRVWMVDADGREFLSLRASSDATASSVSSEPLIRNAILGSLPGLLALAQEANIERLVQTPGGLLAVAASHILPTSERGEPRGILVFARFVDAKLVGRAQLTSRLALHLYLSRASIGQLPAAAQSLWQSAPGGAARALIESSDSLLTGYQLLRDVRGAPVALLATDIPRGLILFGQQTGRSLILIISAVMGLFALSVSGLMLYLDEVVASRAASERRYRAVITQAQETMLLVDTQSRQILEANPAASTTLGFAVDELVSTDIDALFFACDDDVLKPVHAETHAAAKADRTLLVRCKNKAFIDVEVTASPLSIDGRDVTSFVLRDVSARRRAERHLVYNQDQLAHLAHHDALTGLLNRLGLERRLPEVIDAARRSGRAAAFLYIDLDNFKKINDLRGHPCGDKLLCIAAARLRQCLSFNDLIVRMGGDEFVVVAAELRGQQSADKIAARICEQLAVPFEVDGQHLKVTASIGVSVFPNDGSEYEALLKNADIAMYQSKEAGRNAYTLFTAEMIKRVTERLAFEVELREAIQSGQFYLDYQPLVDPRTQRVASLEALVRWYHPIQGRVPPLQFIGIAERTGQICEIGAFVIREVCRQLGEWRRGGVPLVPVALNVSSLQLEQHTLIDVLRNAIRDEGIAPALLRIEITESVFIDGSEKRLQHLNEIREMGVQVSVDDFGTGYSSLAYLKQLPIDCLKIDRAFIRDLETSKADEAIVRAIIRMAQSLGLSTVAEGVETPEQARRLSELGANFIQGYYFSPPLAVDACGRMLQSTGTVQTETAAAAGVA
jgi:diguanylate cyclase (GGDEF)-like protein/PAS domain S-box-containing protein